MYDIEENVQLNTTQIINLQVTVESTEVTVVSPTQIIGVGAARRVRRSDIPDVSTGDFQRLSSGGSFELSGYTPGNQL